MTSAATLRPTELSDPLDVLYESQRLDPDLPDRLLTLYGGPLGLTRPALYANFVATLDGVAALPEVPKSSKLISGNSAADRFVMGLLRAAADAVLIGSGTLRGSPRTRWTAEHTYPAEVEAFAELRRNRGLSPTPTLVVLTGTGAIDPDHPALAAGTLVMTTRRGAESLRGRLPGGVTVVTVGGGERPDPARAVAELRRRGHRIILSEAGPHLFGSLLAAGLVDELFLTQSPVLAGSASPNALRLVEGAPLLGRTEAQGTLLSVRRHRGHVFLRYAFG